MAGIGFELRKLFGEKDKPFGDIKAVAYSAVVSVGPWIMTCLSLNIIIFLAGSIERTSKVVYSSTVLYAFVFSQLLTGPFQYLVTRYVADCVYMKKIHQIRGTYIGVVKIILTLGFFVSYFFIKGGNFSGNYKAFFVILFITMSLLWITMIFISLLRTYSFMIKSFFAGNLISIGAAYIFLKHPVAFLNEPPIFWMLFSYTLGIFLNFLFTSIYILNAFKGENKSNYGFLNYLKNYFSFFLIGLFYILGVWGHIMVNWVMGDSYIVGGVFYVSPLYEVAVFYAFCTTIPSMVYSVIFLETRFYPVYKKYYENILFSGNYREVNRALKKMYDTLYREMLYCMELQFLISLTFVFTANVIFDYLRVDLYLLDIFRISVLSAYCVIFISIFITIFLYFDSREYALLTAFIFFGGGIIFSYIFGKMGSGYVGLGFFTSSFLTFGAACMFNKRIFKNLNYMTMFKRNFSSRRDSPLLQKIDTLMGKKVYLAVIFISLILFSGCTRYDKRGFNNTTKRNHHTMSIYDFEGYDSAGRDSARLDKRGFNEAGWNEFTNTPYDYQGFDDENTNSETGLKYDERGFDYKKYNVLTASNYDKNGFDCDGMHKDTKGEYDHNGWNCYGVHLVTKDYYNEHGFDFEGYDREGFNQKGYTREALDRRGFNQSGWNGFTNSAYDYQGFSIKNIHRDTGTKYDERGFDIKGDNNITKTKFDSQGFDCNGIHQHTKTEYSLEGWSCYGINKTTKGYYDNTGYTFEGLDRDGYTKDNRPAEMGAVPLTDYRDEIDKSQVDKDGFNKDGIYTGGY